MTRKRKTGKQLVNALIETAQQIIAILEEDTNDEA